MFVRPSLVEMLRVAGRRLKRHSNVSNTADNEGDRVRMRALNRPASDHLGEQPD